MNVTWKNITQRPPRLQKGHQNQSRKTFRSTKPKRTPLQVPNTSTLQGRKVHNVYGQTGRFPTRLLQGKKFTMVMVKIDNNAILVDPIKSCKDADITRAYQTMMLRLRRAGIIPKKHILDNKVSEALKKIIQDEYNMQM